MQRLEVRGAVRPIYGSLCVKRLIYRPRTGQSAVSYFSGRSTSSSKIMQAKSKMRAFL